MTDAELAHLRAEQAKQHQREEEADRQNRWMPAPVLAPEFLVMGVEAAGALAARSAAKRLAAIPNLRLNIRPPNGNTYRAILGKRAHAELQAAGDAKDGWTAEGTLTGNDGKIYRPDLRTPPRELAPDGRLIELKLKTTRGRAPGVRQKGVYEEQLDRPTRIIYYDPNKYRR
jgi:hypothetical protein